MASMASWFSGFGNVADAPSCSQPPASKQMVETVPDVNSTPVMAQDNGPAHRRRDEDKKNADDDLEACYADLPSDFRAALKRMTSSLKAQLNAQDDKISQMQETLDSQAAEIGLLRTEPAVKEYSLMDQQSSTVVSQMDAGTLNSLKDDVQTIIDAMRVDLGRQKTDLRNLADQVQGGKQGLQKESSMLSNDSYGGSGGGSRSGGGGYISIQRFEEMHAELKREIGVMSTDLRKSESNSQTGMMSRQMFDRFSEEVGKQMDQFAQELVDMRHNQELGAVKAGFLAVAATECSHEEKEQMFKTLKEQEEQCAKKAARSSMRASAISTSIDA